MRGASIQIGAGALVAGMVGFWNDSVAFAFLIALGIILLTHGAYDDFVKPRFRVDRRLADWFTRRGWKVETKRKSGFNFILHITAPDSQKEIIVTRDKDAEDDVLAFTARVGLHPEWITSLNTMPDVQRGTLLQEITLFLATKDVGLVLNDPRNPDSPIDWPPDVKVQTALPQDHTLSQHSVDTAAKKIEASMIGVRAIIRRAVLENQGGGSSGAAQDLPA